MPFPELPHGCGSWIIADRVTGNAKMETFSRTDAELIFRECSKRYEVFTAVAWLAKLNETIASGPVEARGKV